LAGAVTGALKQDAQFGSAAASLAQTPSQLVLQQYESAAQTDASQVASLGNPAVPWASSQLGTRQEVQLGSAAASLAHTPSQLVLQQYESAAHTDASQVASLGNPTVP